MPCCQACLHYRKNARWFILENTQTLSLELQRSLFAHTLQARPWNFLCMILVTAHSTVVTRVLMHCRSNNPALSHQYVLEWQCWWWVHPRLTFPFTLHHVSAIMREYRKTSCISCTKFQNLNVSCLLLKWALPNPLKPGVKLRMKM